MACLLDLLNREKDLVHECECNEEHIKKLQRELELQYTLLEENRYKLKQTRGFIKKYFEGECQ